MSTFADRIEAEYAARATRPTVEVVEPVEGDVCEICGRPIEAGEPAVRPQSHVCTWDPETGRARYTWEHQSCRQEVSLAAMRAADRVAEQPPHHDPTVCDLLRRVEALEARKR